MKKILITSSMLMLTGCTNISSQWMETIEGNDIDVISGTSGDSRFITVENKLRTWNGSYQGGEEMVPARKALFTKLANEEAKRVCCPQGFVMDGSPSYTMTERNADHYGGGLLGYVIASAAASYENLPVSGHYNFRCTSSSN